MTEHQNPKIFLSYAHEDIGMAKRIHQDLKRYGLDVWIDYESLLPGQNWKITIEKAIKGSHFYFLLLSSHSMSKRGFIQKEMRIAYEMLEQCSEDDIYLIPIRLDECEPSLKISNIQYIDVFPESEYQNGLKRILQVVSPETFIIRHEPRELSPVEVNKMLKVHGYYERDRNPAGRGINHRHMDKEINGDKILIGKVTGLMWQKAWFVKIMEYEKAKDYIDGLNRRKYAGFADWRLPTLEEAMSLIKPGNRNSDTLEALFELWIWTGDLMKDRSMAWIVNLDSGYCDICYFNDSKCVCAVRTIK